MVEFISGKNGDHSPEESKEERSDDTPKPAQRKFRHSTSVLSRGVASEPTPASVNYHDYDRD
jgi:hypothetical protein